MPRGTFERQKNGGWVVLGHFAARESYKRAAPQTPDFGVLRLGDSVGLPQHGRSSIAKVDDRV